MKGHIGVDRKTKLINSIVATAVNVYESQVLGDLLHGEETHRGTSFVCLHCQILSKNLVSDKPGAIQAEIRDYPGFFVFLFISEIIPVNKVFYFQLVTVAERKCELPHSLFAIINR